MKQSALMRKLPNPGGGGIFGARKSSNNLNAQDTLLGKCQGHQYWSKKRVVTTGFWKMFSFLMGFMLICLGNQHLIKESTNICFFEQCVPECQGYQSCFHQDYLQLKQSAGR